MKSKRAREAAEADETPVDAVAEAPAKKRKRDGDQDGAAVKKSKKDKKDKKDKKKDKKESRKEKKEKRKDLRNLPEEDGLEEDANGEAAAAPEPETKAVNGTDKDKEQKKREKRELKKQKKQEKGENKAKNAPPPKKEEANGDIAAAGKESPNEIDLDASTATKPDRHIVFVGNLPFSATAATISAHFASLSPIAVRCLKNKDDDNPCRGIAFVEFGKVWHQRTCLDKFHHSMFEDGVSPARRINVELTAGGGGKAKARQNKIHEKNQKLEENRNKRIEKEKNAKEESRREAQSGMEDSIHPSRRARVPGFGQ